MVSYCQELRRCTHRDTETMNLQDDRGASLIRNSAPLGPYSRTMPRALKWSQGEELILMSEVLLWFWLDTLKNRADAHRDNKPAALGVASRVMVIV